MVRWLQYPLVALAVTPLLAGTAGAADVYLELASAGESLYTVDGRFWTPADPTGVWNVLSDYDHLPSFIPSLLESRIEKKSADDLLLYQEAVAKALGIFHRHLRVLLRVKEQPEHAIHFEDTAHRDFDSYRGTWQIEQAGGGGSWVRYHLEAKPNFFAPAFVARKSFQANARALLLSVQSEMMRRGHWDDTRLCCSVH